MRSNPTLRDYETYVGMYINSHGLPEEFFDIPAAAAEMFEAKFSVEPLDLKEFARIVLRHVTV